MKICVIAPTQEYLNLAGVRIRYLRIEEHLRAQGHQLSIEVIETFRALSHFKHDVYLFSKCYDARSVLIARLLSKTGKLVGIDFFDDYFSQKNNSSFVCHREWARTMAEFVDFFLCSTLRMQEAISAYMPDIPSHILNDPFDNIDLDKIAATSERNLERTLSTGQLEVAWFGVGDNPHFAVGLRDLFAFRSDLHDLGRSGFTVKLSILTNRRALTAEGLEMIRRLPVSYSLDEWSVDKEAALLANSLVAFIPVNSQPFSIVKSLNRAVSALTNGAQVLSSGYPLYEQFGSFIYRDAHTLLADIVRKQLVMRKQTLPDLQRLFAECADPVREAEKLAVFLAKQLKQNRLAIQSKTVPEASLGLIHGARSPGECHKFAQRFRYLSISSPFGTEGPNYDVRFVFVTDNQTLEVQLDERAWSKLKPGFEHLLEPKASRTGRAVKSLNLSALFPDESDLIAKVFKSNHIALKLTRYGAVMNAVRQVIISIFPGIELYLSETEAPYWLGFSMNKPQISILNFD